MSLLGQIKIGIILSGPLFDLFYDRSLVAERVLSGMSAMAQKHLDLGHPKALSVFFALQYYKKLLQAYSLFY